MVGVLYNLLPALDVRGLRHAFSVYRWWRHVVQSLWWHHVFSIVVLVPKSRDDHWEKTTEVNSGNCLSYRLVRDEMDFVIRTHTFSVWELCVFRILMLCDGRRTAVRWYLWYSSLMLTHLDKWQMGYSAPSRDRSDVIVYHVCELRLDWYQFDDIRQRPSVELQEY